MSEGNYVERVPYTELLCLWPTHVDACTYSSTSVWPIECCRKLYKKGEPIFSPQRIQLRSLFRSQKESGTRRYFSAVFDFYKYQIYVRTMNISIKMSSFSGRGDCFISWKVLPSCRYNPRLWSIGGLACPIHTALEKLAASSFSCPTSGQKISPLIVTRERQIVWDYIVKEWRAGEGNKCVKRTWPSVTMKGCLLLTEFL